jgi:hypothetical protein
MGRVDNVVIGSVIAGNMRVSAASGSATADSCGLLARKVVGISTVAGGNTVLITQPATLLDMVLEAHVDVADATAAAMDTSINNTSQLHGAAQRPRAVTGVGKLSFKIPNKLIPWDLKASYEGKVQAEPIVDVSVRGGLSYDITHPPGSGSAAILASTASERLQRAVVSAEVKVTIGVKLEAELAGGIEKEFDFTEGLAAMPLAPFPCLPPPLTEFVW